MKRLFALLVIAAASSCLHAQVVDTTVCDVLKAPQSFNGKIVRIKGTVSTTLDQFVIKDSSGCGHHVNAIWLSYPDGAKAKSGPAAILQLQPARNFAGKHEAAQRTPVVLEKSKEFKQFDSLLNTLHKGPGMCLGCTRYTVSATVVGRLDGVAEAGVKRDASGKIISFEGFGNLNEYPARLVIQSVSEVTPHEIDYSKADLAAKGEQSTPAMGMEGPGTMSDPLELARRSALGFGPGNAMGEQIERAVDAFGKQGQHNGASIGYGNANEASSKEDAPGKSDSPDGILFNCTFNMSRLPESALTRAIVHVGEHIADLRNPTKESAQFGPFELEFQAWEMGALSAVASGQKTMAMPGGYMVWDTTWAASDRDNLLNEALMKFLSTEELFTR